MKTTSLFFAATLFAASSVTAAAQTCPVAADTTAEIAELLNAVRSVDNEGAARAISQQMWALWATAPDARAQELLDAGMTRRSQYDFATAESVLTELIAYCPDYAEGWNQRAFVRFLRGDFDNALTDLDKALSINPVHVAALSGKALTLLNMGREIDGQKVLRDALELNPWLSERALLRPIPEDTL